MNNYRVHDNGRFHLQHLLDGKSVPSEDKANLQSIANVNLRDLHPDDYPNLLIFPDRLVDYGDDIGSSPIFGIEGDHLVTGNLMGFIGVKNTGLAITSRSAEGKEDFFLHYMLTKVFSLNIFDLSHSSKAADVFDFLLYLFPNLLVKALAQGIIRKYQHCRFNDARVKGQINVAMHLRTNIPFNGNIAYSIREYSVDNEITQLVRHTIEYISCHPYGASILNRDNEVRSAVNAIKIATPSYSVNDRNTIINRNRRGGVHPFYTEFEPLQRLCLQILNGEGLKYGENDDEIYGILFDGAWLWEEYLNTLMRQLGYKHPKNKEGIGAISLFEKGGYPRYPDFLKKGAVADAKYKKINSSG
ncbi:MAG: hypothetical protein K2O88_02110, partial [Paramuribaculum sp.]|nr:hypothetical protein [Paramuribaculum sp.]